MSSTSLCVNQPSLFLRWNRTGERFPSSRKSYCAHVSPASVDTMMPAPISPWILVVMLSGMALLITEAISNAAAVVVLVPLSYGFVAQTGLTPEVLTLIVTIPTGLAFCLPVGTPPNAIAFSSGYFTVRDSFKIGLLLKLIAWVMFLLTAKFYWPLLGLGL